MGMEEGTIRVLPEHNLSHIPGLYILPHEIREISIELILNDDGSINEVIELKAIITNKDLYNYTLLEVIKLSPLEKYEDVKIYDLSQSNLDFYEVTRLVMDECVGKYTLNKQNNELRFCTRIHKENEVNYRIETYILPQKDLNIYGKKKINHKIGYTFDYKENNFPFSITLEGGENVLLDYSDMEGRCPNESWKYITLRNGVKCSGEMVMFEGGDCD